jgi:TonB family protein
MSSYTHPAWDKNRSIYFQLGLIISLIAANVIINSEFQISNIGFNEYTIIDAPLQFQEMRSHNEISEVQKQYTTKPNPLAAKIVLVQNSVPVASVPDIPTTTVSTNSGLENLPVTKEYKAASVITQAPKPPDNKVWIVAESMPYLKVCDQSITADERKSCTNRYMLDYIQNNLKYPKAARELTIEGTVIVSFVIDIYGNMKDITVSRDIGGGCGQAAINALNGLSAWVPGRQNNQAVNVKYTIPIKFKLD